MKIIKRVLLTLIGLAALLLGALLIALFFIDPNQYKPKIEETAHAQTGLEVKLGDIQWRIFPTLGLKLGDIQLRDPTLKDETTRTLLSAQSAGISLALMPLLSGSVEVDALELHQPTVHYVTFNDGSANWDTLLKQNTTPSPEATQSQTSPALDQFSISRILLENARILLEDKANQTSTSIDAFTLKLEDVAVDQAVKIDFHTKVSQDDTLQIQLSGTGAVIAAANLTTFNIPELKLSITIDKAPGLANPQVATLTLAANVDLEADQANIPSLNLQMAELVLTAQAKVLELTKNPNLEANLTLNPLPLKAWLKKTLDVTLPPMQNPNALNQVFLSTDIKATALSTAPSITLNPFSLSLDKSTLKGNIAYAIKSQAVKADLTLDSIILDDYLPPAEENKATDSTPQAPTTADESPLIPVEIIRPLNATVSLKAKEVVYDKIPMKDGLFEINAKNGLVQINALNTSIFGGNLTSTGSLDVRGPEPKISLQHQAKALQLQAFLAQFVDSELAQGLASFDLSLNTHGNRVADLFNALSGKSQISVTEGLIKGVNLTQMAQTQLTQWSPLISTLVPEDYANKVPPALQKDTQIKQLLASLEVRDGQLLADSLSADLSGSAVTGQGKVDLSSLNGSVALNLKLSEKMTNPTLAKLTWPIVCQGGMSASFGCKLDASPVRKEIEKMVKHLAEDKAKSALNQKLQEKLGTTNPEAAAKEEIQQKIDDEKERANKKINDKLKSKLGNFF